MQLNWVDLRDWSLHLMMSGMPIDMCSALGARLAPRLGRGTHPVSHDRAMRVMARLRPDLGADPRQCETAVDRLWANIGRTFAEFAVSHRMLKTGRVSIDREDRLDDALKSGRPILAIFPHLGNWELSEMQFGFKAPHRGAVIVQPPKSPARAAMAERIRKQAPAELLTVSRTVWRRGLQRLKQPGGILMVAVDENAGGQVRGPALGRAPRVDSNLGKVARLALTTEAIVLPFYSERLAGAHLTTRFLPIMEFVGTHGTRRPCSTLRVNWTRSSRTPSSSYSTNGTWRSVSANDSNVGPAKRSEDLERQDGLIALRREGLRLKPGEPFRGRSPLRHRDHGDWGGRIRSASRSRHRRPGRDRLSARAPGRVEDARRDRQQADGRGLAGHSDSARLGWRRDHRCGPSRACVD
jgi:lauroyl/myristoyl acyltransferase